jgi:hypothetical protein
MWLVCRHTFNTASIVLAYCLMSNIHPVIRDCLDCSLIILMHCEHIGVSDYVIVTQEVVDQCLFYIMVDLRYVNMTINVTV